jgi:exodeoxyribonuclease VII small subunit
MSNTGPEGTVPGAAPGSAGAGLRPAGADAGEGRERTFEELQKELEEIVARLERGDVAVDDAIALFKHGEELHKACVERLDAAQVRIEELSLGNRDTDA